MYREIPPSLDGKDNESVKELFYLFMILVILINFILYVFWSYHQTTNCMEDCFPYSYELNKHQGCICDK